MTTRSSPDTGAGSQTGSGPAAPEILIYPDGRTVVIQPEPPERAPLPLWQQAQFQWAIVLFLATAFSTWMVGERRYSDGLGYMIPVMLILLAHEMGHYLTSLIYRVPASLPFFLPMPFTPLGTFGAVIVKQAGGREDRKALFDIAIAGPLAGLVVAIPVCVYGAMTAIPVPVEEISAGEYVFVAPPVVIWIMEAVRGELPARHDFFSATLDAGWVGIFITALNLIPIGQLDGGHILYSLIGKRAHRVALGLIVGSFAYMMLSGNITFILMLLLITLVGPYHPPTANDHVPLGRFRVILGWLTLSFILIGFTPTPIIMIPG